MISASDPCDAARTKLTIRFVRRETSPRLAVQRIVQSESSDDGESHASSDGCPIDWGRLVRSGVRCGVSHGVAEAVTEE